jgi:hypothetical protein
MVLWSSRQRLADQPGRQATNGFAIANARVRRHEKLAQLAGKAAR